MLNIKIPKILSNYRISKGFLTFIVGLIRIQLYWPEILLRKGELYFRFETIFRAVWMTNRFAIGFRILGFGFGFDYENYE